MGNFCVMTYGYKLQTSQLERAPSLSSAILRSNTNSS